MRWLVALCTLQTTMGQVVASAGLGTAFIKYPNYAGAANFNGFVNISSTGPPGSQYRFDFQLSGAEASAGVRFAIHAGISCASVVGIGGHFWAPFNDVDPWTGLAAVPANASGVVNGNTLFFKFGYERDAFLRHALVLYDNATVPAACALITDENLTPFTPVYPTTLGKYPGYGGALTVAGLVNVWDVGNTIQVQFQLTGLSRNATGGIHVHTGRNCGSSGPHFWLPANASDPWTSPTATYSSDDNGKADGTFNINIGTNADATRYHAVVAHDNDGAKTRAGCGLLGPGTGSYTTTDRVLTFASYPGSTGPPITGTLSIQQFSPLVDNQYRFVASFSGAPVNSTVNVHIHAGYNCSDAGGHFFKPFTAPDPWTTVSLATDGSGNANSSFELDFGYPRAYFTGHTVVIHNTTDKVSCGVITDTSGNPPPAFYSAKPLTPYPGYTPGLTVTGEVNTVGGLNNAVLVHFRLKGLRANATGGIHLHNGSTCDTAGPHLWVPMVPPDPWTAPGIGYSSNANGDAEGAFELWFGLDANGIGSRTAVVHDNNGTRVACALLTTPDPCPGSEITGVFSACRIYDLIAGCSSACTSATAAFVNVTQTVNNTAAVVTCLRSSDAKSKWVNGNLSLLIDRFQTDPTTICPVPVAVAPGTVATPLCVGLLALLPIVFL